LGLISFVELVAAGWAGWLAVSGVLGEHEAAKINTGANARVRMFILMEPPAVVREEIL
jgi:hypothetical protein